MTKVPEIVDEAQQETKTNDDQVEVTNSDNTETVKGTIENGNLNRIYMTVTLQLVSC